jgi:hypothetical protein
MPDTMFNVQDLADELLVGYVHGRGRCRCRGSGWMDDGGRLKAKLKINSHMCESNIVKQNMQLINKDQLNKHIRFNKHTTSSVDQFHDEQSARNP